ncbi:C2 domain-containing protein [Achlya hypogyna]|uniref:C2 domain-containing protein n=1 Tax=Achlya hypogyna TaxID=1202772 RepID=A0A1V9ZGS5_ACHHY|nr:C2 domain-containing protein [Achlya hypogyna]
MTDARLLRITLHAAKDLAAADYTFGGFSRGKSDPYVVLRVGDQRFRSTCIASTLNPNWGAEVFEFTLTESAMYAQALVVEVYDHDLFNADDLIGTAVQALAQFELEKGPRTVAWPLDVPDSFLDQKVQSTLHVSIHVTVPDGIVSELVEEMIESQKWLPFKGWSPHKMIKTKEPVIPAGYTSAVGWVISLHEQRGDPDNNNDDDLCHEGWLYAAGMEGPWYKSSRNHPTAVCRKRVWTKTYMKTRRTLTTTQQDETIDAILDKYGLKDDDEDNQWLQ